MRKTTAALLTGLAIAGVGAGLSAGLSTPALAATATGQPVLGYSTWYEFHANINEADVLAEGKALVSSGLASSGYDYVDIDDGWAAPARGAGDVLAADPAKFPHGISWLAAQLHAEGLKLGIYTAIGSRTCKGLPGSGGGSGPQYHYAQDAATFASWGVDLVKVDECGGLPAGATTATVTQDFRLFGADLKADNPAIVYSEELPIYVLGHNYPDPANMTAFLGTVQASKAFGGTWRITPDELPASMAKPSATVLAHLAADLHLHGFAGPGHWNDQDMVLTPEVPGFGWTDAAMQGQLAVWAEEASPLIVSTNVASLSAAELAMLKNPAMLAIDSSGAQAPSAITSGHIEAVMKNADGGKAVLLANLGTGTGSGKFTLAQLGLSGNRASGLNVWTGKTNTFSGVTVTMTAGQTELYVIKSA